MNLFPYEKKYLDTYGTWSERYSLGASLSLDALEPIEPIVESKVEITPASLEADEEPVPRDLRVEDLLPVFADLLLGGLNDSQQRTLAERLLEHITAALDPTSSDYLQPGEMNRIPFVACPEFMDAVQSRGLASVMENESRTPALWHEAEIRKVLLDASNAKNIPMHYFCVIELASNGRMLRVLLQPEIGKLRIACTYNKEVFRAQRFNIPLVNGKYVEGTPITCVPKVVTRVNPADSLPGWSRTLLSPSDRKVVLHDIRTHRRLLSHMEHKTKQRPLLHLPERLGTMPNAKGKRWESIQEDGGIDLFEIKNGRLDLGNTIQRNISIQDVIKQLLSASDTLHHYFHKHGYVHRDIKGGNLLMDGRDALSPISTKVIDCGLTHKFGKTKLYSLYPYWDSAGQLGWVLPSTDVYGLMITLAFHLFPDSPLQEYQCPGTLMGYSDDVLTATEIQWMVSTLQHETVRAARKYKADCNPHLDIGTLSERVKVACEAILQNMQQAAVLNPDASMADLLDAVRADIYALRGIPALPWNSLQVTECWEKNVPIYAATFEHLLLVIKESRALSKQIEDSSAIRDALSEKGLTPNKLGAVAELQASFPLLTVQGFQDFCHRLLAL